MFIKVKLCRSELLEMNQAVCVLTRWSPVQGGLRQEDDMEVARAGRELNQEVNRLMVAMRDMLANIRFQEPPREDNPYRDDEEWD